MRRSLLRALTCLTLLAGAGCSQDSGGSGSVTGKTGPEQAAPEAEAEAKSPAKPTDEGTPQPASTAGPAEPAPEPKLAETDAPKADADADAKPKTEAKLPGAVLEAAKQGYELLAAGSEPLVALRFHPQVGQAETIKLTMRMSMSISGPGMPANVQKLPPIEQVNRAETLSVADGRIEEKIVFESFSVSAEGVDAQVASMLQSTMEQIKGFEQVMVYDERGGVVEGELTIPPDANPQLAQTLETMGKTFEQVMVRLPEDPVGVGAKWRETSEFDNNGIKLEQTSQFEVVGLEGDALTLDTQITQKPLSDTFVPPNMPTGEVKLLDFDSKGAGEVVYDLSKMMPQRVETHVETKFSIEATAMGQTQKLTTAITIDLSLESVE